MLMQENNGIATLDLDTFMSDYYYLGTKDWSQYSFDASYEDNGKDLIIRFNLDRS